MTSISHIIKNNMIDKLKTIKLNKYMVDYINKDTDFEIIKLFVNSNIKYSYFYKIAIPNLENIKWLRENGCIWNECTFEHAIENDDLEIIKWFRDNGCPYSKITSLARSLPVMEWLRTELKYKFRSSIYLNNADNIDVMKWLRGKNCQIHPHTYIYMLNLKKREIGW